jgi:hypothetical protein
MSVFKFGQRYALFGCRQAAELTLLAKQVGRATFHRCQQLAQDAGADFCIRTRNRRLLVATLDTRSSTGTRSRNCHRISVSLFGEPRFNRVDLEGSDS